MNVAGPLLLVAIIFLARIVGERYGWYYHAAILAVLAVALGALFRLAAPKPLPPAPTLPPIEDPQGKKMREFLEAAHKDLDVLIPAMHRDAKVIPILACAPAVVVLCVLQQSSYAPDHRLWFRLGFIPVLVYAFVRYVFPKTYRRRA